MKIALSILLTCLITNFTIGRKSIDGLEIKFKKVTESYILWRTYPVVGSLSTIPSEGFKYVKLKVILKNSGTNVCNFDWSEVYMSTEKDSLYAFLCMEGSMKDTKIKIKPSKEISSNVYFEFPEHAQPKELFIEDKRFKIEAVEE